MGEKKLYPLTAGQEVINFNLKFSVKQAVVNICAMMHFENEIDLQMMIEAAKLGLKRNIAASTRITLLKDKSTKQYFYDGPVEGLEIIDYSKKSQKAFDKLIKKMSSTPFPNKSRDVQLYNIKLIKKPDGMCGLYLCVSHLVFDAYSLMYMASDILAIYRAMRDGTEMPKDKYRTLEAYEYDHKLSESEQKQKDLKFWGEEIFATEPQFTSLNGLDAKEWKKDKRYGEAVHIFTPKATHINKTLKKETVDKINAFALERKLSPKCVYLLALRSILAKKSGFVDDVVILDNLVKRATIIQKNAGGTAAQGIFVRMKMSNDLTFEAACNEIQQLQYKMFAHSIPTSMEIINTYESKYKKPPTCGYAFMSFTYQPYSVAYDETLPVHFTIHSNGYNTMPVYLTVMALDNSGDLNFNYDINLSFVKPERIEEVHSYILKFIDKAISEPQTTLRELMEIK